MSIVIVLRGPYGAEAFLSNNNLLEILLELPYIINVRVQITYR